MKWRWQSMHTDALLWIIIGAFTAMSASLSTDDSYKYVDPKLRWWMLFRINAILGGALSLKMFRSTSFAKHLAANPEPTNHLIVAPEPVKEPVKPTPPVIQ